MTTYSTSLKLSLIADGDQAGVWGQTTNTNLGTLLEQAITGVVSITMLDANYTLTDLNGVSDEARNAVLVVGGTNTGIKDVIAPAVKKLYSIKNDTVGGYAIRIKTAGGAAVTVPNGVTTTVYCDGTDFYEQKTGTNGNFTVGGALGVTGLLSGTTATFSGAISSVSPSFTGTPTAPTAVAGTNTTQIATTAFVTTAAASAIPSGVILLWSGSIASIPSGWYLCNGSNGTPDLRDKFIVGAGSTYAVAATGGSADAITVAHTHTASSAVTDPGHKHTTAPYSAYNMDYGPASGLASVGGTFYTSNSTTGITVATTVNSSGSSGTNANLPPYYALAYIMKA